MPAVQGHPHVLQSLINRGAPLDRKDRTQRSALSLAAAAGNVECVRVLLACSAARGLIDDPTSIGCPETRGRTPLLLAAGRGHLEV